MSTMTRIVVKRNPLTSKTLIKFRTRSVDHLYRRSSISAACWSGSVECLSSDIPTFPMKCSSLSATCPLQRRARPPSRQRRGYNEGPKSRRFLHLASLSPTPDPQARSRSRNQPEALELVLLHGPPHHHR